MKVYLNLAVARSRRERYSLAWAIPTLVVSLLVLAWLATSVVRDMRHSRKVQQSLAQVKSQDAKIQAREIHLQQQISQPQFKRMIRETKFVNQLLDQRKFSLTELTFRISKLLPPSARLNGLALASASDTSPEVQFAVMGKTEEAIETFLDNLEGSNDFSDVVIKSQGFHGGNGAKAQQVALVCTARYVPPPPQASDK